MNMKTIKNILPLLILAWVAVGCQKEPEKGGVNEALYTLQRANVRMEIKGQGRQHKNVGIVGDSVSVRRLARWGYGLFARITEGNSYPANVGRIYKRNLNIDEWSFGRDTVACIYIFDFTSVFDYKLYETFLDGRHPVGRPGTEETGWLLWSETPVMVGYYDTVRNCYKDPYITAFFDGPGYDPDRPDWEWNWEIDSRIDTMGYIPQSMMEANQPRLQQLYDEGRYGEMVEVMKTGYTIYTCTGEEYRELVRLGLN